MLPFNSPIYIVTGMSGVFEERAEWLVAAYSTPDAADKARQKLQKEANKMRDAISEDEANLALRNLKLLDPNAWSDDGFTILYNVDTTTYVV